MTVEEGPRPLSAIELVNLRSAIVDKEVYINQEDAERIMATIDNLLAEVDQAIVTGQLAAQEREIFMEYANKLQEVAQQLVDASEVQPADPKLPDNDRTVVVPYAAFQTLVETLPPAEEPLIP